MKKPGLAAGVRIVPGDHPLRDGAFIRARRDLHAADVREHWRLHRGADARRFARAHRIVRANWRARARERRRADRRVIEPVGALPVIIEDDVLVGGNTGIYEGAVIKARAVIAAGTIITGSTPVFDLVNAS